MRPANAVDLLVHKSLLSLADLRVRLLNRGDGAVHAPGAHRALPTTIEGHGEDRYLRSGPIHRSLWRTIEWRLLEPICPALPRPLGDVGCGDGEFGATLFEKVDVGIDTDAPSVEYCKDSPVYDDVVLTDVRKSLGVPDGSLACVFSNSTFEHIQSVEEALGAVARALRPEGRFVFTVPSSGLERAFGEAYGGGFSRELNGILAHHNLWSSSTWTEKLRAAGFANVDFRGYMTDETACWFAWLHFKQNRIAEKKDAPGFWTSHMPKFHRLVRESLAERDEAKTACLYLDATRGPSTA